MITNTNTAKELAYKALAVFNRADQFIRNNDREGALISYGRAVGYMQSILEVQWNYNLSGLIRYKQSIEDRLFSESLEK